MARAVSAATLSFAACSMLSGCLIAGFSTASGESFLWPGGLGLIVILALILWFLLRTR
jgi:hypothetical protein